LHYSQLPLWMRDNEFIHRFYRPPSPSIGSCLKSLLYLHNESVNIYTHALGAMFFLICGSLLTIYELSVHTSTFSDAAVMTVFLVGAIACMGLSASFHLMSCHSETVCRSWNRCDYVGIVLLIVGSFYPAIYYVFYCDTATKVVYLTTITILGALTLFVCVPAKFQGPEFRPVRAVVFSALGLSGVIPGIHAFTRFGVEHMLDAMSVGWFAAMGALYLLGALIYGARVPERWFPGKFDLWCHSHQIFHCFVFIAAWSHYIGVMRGFRFWHAVDPFCSI